MHGERNAGSRFAVPPLSFPRAFPPFSFSTSLTMTMSPRVILFPRCRGYVLPIINALDDRSHKQRVSGFHETYWFRKGYFIAYYIM